ENLAEVMVIRRRLKRLGATALSAVNGPEQVKISLSFVPEPPVDGRDLALRAQREPQRYVILPSGKVGIMAPTVPEGDREFLRVVRHEVGQLKTTA
ncbi:MAG: hypothetical protein AAF658_05835, partial [Myxococcota bacterium]